MHARIVILTNHSLFVEGIISCLTRQPECMDLQVVDLNHPNALDEVVSARPTAIILDGRCPESLQPFTLQELVQMFPELTIIRLDNQMLQIQVLRCEQRMVDEIRDLIDLIEATTTKQDE